MKKRGIQINIHFSNRWLYTFIFLGILALATTGIYAVVDTNQGWHSSSQIDFADSSIPATALEPCGEEEILKYTTASGWDCVADTGGGGEIPDPLPANVLNIAGKWRLSDTNNDEWLRIFDDAGTGYYGGIAVNRLHTNNEIYLRGNNIDANGNGWPDYADSAYESNPTVRPWAKTDTGDISGNTLTANVNWIGNIAIYYADGLCTNGRPPGVDYDSIVTIDAWAPSKYLCMGVNP